MGDGKDPLHLTGAVEQVLDQLKVSHPEFEAKVETAVAVKRWEYEGHFCFGR